MVCGLTCSDLDEAKDDDDAQCHQLGGSEQVLDLGSSSDTDAIDKCQGG